MTRTQLQTIWENLPTWAKVLLIFLSGELFFFWAAFPLFPKTVLGWVVAIISGLIISVWATGSIIFIRWLERNCYRLFFRAIGAIVAISLGVAIFWLALMQKAFLYTNFFYLFLKN